MISSLGEFFAFNHVDDTFSPFELGLHGFDTQFQGQQPEISLTRGIQFSDLVFNLNRHFPVSFEDSTEDGGGLLEFAEDRSKRLI